MNVAGDASLPELFAVLDELGPDEAALRLTAIEGQNPKLAHELRRLLDAARSTTFGLQLASQDFQTLTVADHRVIWKIAESSSSEVFAAEQSHPVRRLVALKVLKAGVAAPTVSERFQEEARVLALLDHPGIVPVLSAGSTADVRPYFAMPLVRGLDITQHAQAERLSLRDRVGLVIQLGHAVRHAHQRGILHRDLKPSNVLVEQTTSGPLVRVIDFGLARVIHGSRCQPGLTRSGDTLGTPGYMSPEQARGDLERVDTRSDIYSVGAILFELCCGSPPLPEGAARSLSGAALAEVIAATSSARPSRRLPGSGTGDTQEAVGGSAAALRRDLECDLDWICERCLAAEPEGRYAEVGELLLDLERFLAGDPVLARAQHTRYRASKFVRKHRRLVAWATLSLVAVVGGGVTAVAFAAIASRERDTARKATQEAMRQAINSEVIAGFLEESLRGLNPALVETTRAELAAAIRNEVESARDLSNKQEATAAIGHALGVSYARSRRTGLAEESLRQAVELRTAVLGPTDPRTIRSKLELAKAHASLGDTAAATSLLDDIEAAIRGGEDASIRAALLTVRLDIAVKREAVETIGRVTAELDGAMAGDSAIQPAIAREARLGLCNADMAAGRIPSALARGEALLAELVVKAGPDAPETLAVGIRVVQIRGASDPEAARIDLERLIPRLRAVFGATSFACADAHLGLVRFLDALGRDHEAAMALAIAIDMNAALLGDTDAQVASLVLDLVNRLENLRRFADAEGVLGEWIERRGAAGVARPDRPFLDEMTSLHLRRGTWNGARDWEPSTLRGDPPPAVAKRLVRDLFHFDDGL